MENTLENNSGILIKKWKFFVIRAVSYFSFLLIPVWVQKGVSLSPYIQAFIMLFYILFIVSQWFLLGKEIDHRLKIYYRVNSSIDRVVYRLFLGMFFFIIFFNLVNLLDSKWINNTFWVVWGVLGLFYSWPTRGKIIQESVSSNFGEFKFLDNFEKTLLSISVLMLIFSLPDLPPLVNIDTLKMYYDPMEKVGNSFWNFLLVNYYPFKSYPTLFRLGWSMHFYVVNLGFFLLVFYAFLRFFVSRRLSILGVFAVISSWGFNKILVSNIEYALLTTYSLLWVWSLLWVAKSSTYRSGLFLGLVGFWGVLININFFFLIFFQLGLLFFFFIKEKSTWYKKQILKYSSFGLFLSFIQIVNHYDILAPMFMFENIFGQTINVELNRKAFYNLSFFGLLILSLKLFPVKSKPRFITEFQIEKESLRIFLFSLIALIIFSYLFDAYLLSGFSVLWILAFLSLIPLELIFQSLSKLRSHRNIIFVIYILICLLDSHFEGRVKLFIKIFNP